MFNLDYFKFLLKSKKYLLIFEVLVALLFSVTGGTYLPRTLLLVFALAISYTTVFNVFSFIHDKKAIDSYFSLPVERKKILFTGLLFCIAVVYIPYELGIGVNSVLNCWNIIDFISTSLVMLVGFSTLVIFNTLLYFVANNKLDGIIATAAYTLLPYALCLVCICFLGVFVCGNFDFDYDSLLLISPIYDVCLLFSRNIMDCINGIEYNIIDLRYIIALVLELCVSTYLLFFSFSKRKVEVAETVSKRFFAYPLIIALYCFLCMFGISSSFSFSFKSIFDFLSENMLLYIILFVLFVAANFIYQRKFFFNFKMLVYYLCVFALSLVFCFAARVTKGFGLSNNYPKNDPNVKYVLNFNTYAYTDDECNLYQDVYKWFVDKTGSETSWLEFNIEVTHPTDSNTISFFEEKRQSAIDDFYNVDNDDYYYARMNIYQGYKEGSDYNSSEYDLYYSYYDDISIQEILLLVKDPKVKVKIYNDNNEYRLDASGDLYKIEYTEEVYEKGSY